MVKRMNRMVGLLWVLALGLHAHAAGLLAPTDQTLPPLRIMQHIVNVEIHDQVALTTLQQTFRNDTKQRLEGTYVFPLPENAELTNFQMSFNGQMVEGKVLPAQEARRVYESIVRQSKDPGLIEFIGRRLLQMRVFPIEPGSDTKIEVKYQQICKPISGMNGYHYPLRTAKAGGQSYGTVSFAVKLDTTAALKNVWSPTHSIEVVREGEHVAKVAYEASKGSLDEDFLLLYDTNESDLGLSVIAYKPSTKQPGYFVLTMTPKQLWPKDEYQPQDVVFVIDTSGSMAGEKIDQARSALKFCVDKLDDRDSFNIVRFSTGFDAVFEEMTPATKENRSKARTKIDAFTAAGGTNITDAMRAALDMRKNTKEEGLRKSTGKPFVIVFITDGQGNDAPENTLKMVREHPASDGAHIFSFGVGHDVNTILLDQLATNFSGKPTYVQPGENLELVLGDFFSVISQPVLTNLKLTLPEIDASDKFPASLGDLYHGQQLILAGKFETPQSGPVKLTAMRNGQQLEFVWRNVSFNNVAEAKYVPSIWAGRKISFIIDQIRAHGEKPEMVQEVVALSQEYGIQTPYSSWLVNPERQPELARRMRGGDGNWSLPPAPGSATGGGGGGGGGGRFKSNSSDQQQRRALSGSGIGVTDSPADGDDLELPYQQGGQAVTESAGKDATALAKLNGQLRESKAADSAGRLNQAQLARRKIEDRWYNRIGQFLVDESFDEKSTITKVKFGSDAHFKLTELRPQLAKALAASPNIVVMADETHAIVVSDSEGIEQFSDEQLQQAGLAVRKE